MSVHRAVLGHLLVLCFLSALIALGIRTALTKDMRFGWGMFGSSTRYEISYLWTRSDGSTVASTNETGLHGKAHTLLHDGGSHSTSYGIGAVRAWLQGYVQYMVRHAALPGYRSFTATLHYRINGQGEERTETFTALVQS